MAWQRAVLFISAVFLAVAVMAEDLEESPSRVKRCANLMDDSCVNGQLPGAGDDGDYFGSGSSPGKRAQPPRVQLFKNEMENVAGKSRRCANLMDDSCANGQLPGAGDDGDYWNGGSSPGKRSQSSPLLELFKNQMANTGKLRRCANFWDDSCINGQLPGAGDDGDYWNGGSGPGKRAQLPLLTVFQNRMDNLPAKSRRCANLMDDSCVNGQLPGAGDDGDYFGSGSSPGKRSTSLGTLLRHRCALGHPVACRLLAKDRP